MKNYGKIVLLVVLTSWLAAPVWADEMVSVRAGYLHLSPSGDIAATVGGVGTQLNLEDDLGLDASDDVTGEVALQLGALRFSVGYLPLVFAAESTLSRTIDFNGTSYTVGSTVKTNVDIKLYDAALTWWVVNVDDLPVRVQLGPELSVKLVDAKLSLRDLGTSTMESVDASVPIPTVGARARLALADGYGLVGRVGYMTYDGDSLLDADVQVEISPIPLLGVYAGYRLLQLDVNQEDLVVDARFAGPYVGLMFRF